jgi:threonine dehydrogenase-like Zn-dependent dehydrogenase
MGEVDGMVIGHERLGVVEEVGSAVVSIHKGERVVVPTHICMIIAGRAKPSQIVSHRLPLSQAPDAFQKFDQRIDGYSKVILDPQR